MERSGSSATVPALVCALLLYLTPLHAAKQERPGAYQWGDSGPCDGLISSDDISNIQTAYTGGAADYTGCVPPRRDVQEITGDDLIGPDDISSLQDWYIGHWSAGGGNGRPAMFRFADIEVTAGETLRLSAELFDDPAVSNGGTDHRIGWGVVFAINGSESSCAGALLYGRTMSPNDVDGPGQFVWGNTVFEYVQGSMDAGANASVVLDAAGCAPGQEVFIRVMVPGDARAGNSGNRFPGNLWAPGRIKAAVKSPTPQDADNDGLSDSIEQAYCTSQSDPDTDGDGLCDGSWDVYDGFTLMCFAGEDMDLDGAVDPGETDPCNPDTDGDGSDDGADQCPLDPNNWTSSGCADCAENDADGWYAGCDDYNTITGPDCDDAITNAWSDCADCADGDGDWWGSGTSCGATADCDDWDDTIYPGASEVCGDSIDQDCDGKDYKGEWTKIGSDLRVTYDSHDSKWSALAWTGSEFGVSWPDYRDGNFEIYFARVSAGGNTIGSDLRVTYDASYSYVPSLCWTGSEFGNAWQDTRDGNGEIYFARLSADGSTIGSALRVSYAADYSRTPSIAWTGSEFGMSWPDHRDGNWEAYFARVGADGSKIGSELRITYDPDDSYRPCSIAWTGSEFGVSWYDHRDGNAEIYFARVSAGGSKIGSDLRVTYEADSSRFPSLAWTGSEFGVSWEDFRDDGDGICDGATGTMDCNMEIYFARVSAAGDTIGSDIRVTSDARESNDPSLAWTGSEFGVSWDDNRDGNREVYFARVSAGGSKIGSDLRVTYDEGYSEYPSLAWTESEFGVSWDDNRDGNWEVYFARIGQVCP